MSQKLKRYIVTGYGVFPDDMLRYDHARIIGTCRLLDRPAFLIDGYCTETRWQSFLWACFPAREGADGWQALVQGQWEKVDVRRTP